MYFASHIFLAYQWFLISSTKEYLVINTESYRKTNPLSSEIVCTQKCLTVVSLKKAKHQNNIFKRFSNIEVLLISCIIEPKHIVKLLTESRVNTQWVMDISILLPEQAAKQLANIFFNISLWFLMCNKTFRPTWGLTVGLANFVTCNS